MRRIRDGCLRPGSWRSLSVHGAPLGCPVRPSGVPVASKAARPSRPSNALSSEFSNPFLDPLLVAVSSPHQSVDTQPYLDWVRSAASALAQLPQVRRVSSYADAQRCEAALEPMAM